MLTIFLAISCQNSEIDKINKDRAQIAKKLENKINELDSIKNSSPILFDKALREEITNIDNSIEIYKRLIIQDSTTLWKTLAETKIIEFQELQDSTKKYIKHLFWYGNTLILTHQNDRCGEWGGDREIITIKFKKDYKLGHGEGYLYGQYKKYEMNCDSISKPLRLVINSENKLLSVSEERLVKSCIEDLLTHKLNNTGIDSNAGIYNEVVLMDKLIFANDSHSLIIGDYPSMNWSNFHRLKNEIKK